MKPMKLLSAALAGLILAINVQAKELVMEVIPLDYRTLNEILPVLKPLVPKPGTVTGMQNQLVIRTTPANLQEIKEVLARLDQPPRNLLITIKRDKRENLGRQGAELSGEVRSGDLRASADRKNRRGKGLNIGVEREDGDRADLRVYNNRSSGFEVSMQRLHTLEGRPAFIDVGKLMPVGRRDLYFYQGGVVPTESVEYKSVTTGFYVVPRVNGDRVTLEVHPHSERISPRGDGFIDTEEAQTVLSGRLGEWIPVGSSSVERSRTSGDITHSTKKEGESSSTILLRVDEQP